MVDVILDTLLDVVKLLPFLFLTYIVMEYLEHKTGDKTAALVKKAGKFGPVIGGILGIVPQCGFSAAASNLYAGRVITLGTLMAIYLSTSDEMLPILISEQAPIGTILKILLGKAAIGIAAGLVIDLLLRGKNKNVLPQPPNTKSIYTICVSRSTVTARKELSARHSHILCRFPCLFW